ncbi:MAG TPA: LysR family transcriptional regulator [Sphingomicrobium sp.]|jgi:DNA-binding transcriptional LysR family regulator|nr:LysR family transcriptional regulator [Sphingomicrobium sp.]
MAVMLDWNDLRYFIAVADGGSTLAAGRDLRVSQTTVARRIAALEEALGLQIFEKRQAGYALTPAGEELLDRARQVEAAATGFADAAAAQVRDTSGTVRITTQEIFVTLLSPMLRELHEQHPEILIELDDSQDFRDLGEGEADIALRSALGDLGSGVVGRRLGPDDWTLYCSRDYAAAHGVPTTKAQLKRHAFIGGGGPKLWRAYSSWLHDLGLDDRVIMHHASAMGMLSAIRSGLGIAVLPCIVADADPDLVQCVPPKDGHGRVMWLVTHERVRHTPRVRAVIDFLYERLSKHIKMLEARREAAAA